MGVAARFPQSAYAAALAALRPRGRVWPDDPNSQQVQTLSAAAGSFERLDAAAQSLLVDAFPATAVALLPEWELSVGLPDPCVGEGATIAQREAQVVTRLTAVGGQSIPRYIAYAAALGFTIAVATYTPFRCGIDVCGDPLGGDDWSFAWSVHIVADANAFGSAVLLCELNRIAPAETILFLS